VITTRQKKEEHTKEPNIADEFKVQKNRQQGKIKDTHIADEGGGESLGKL
jgi:hypothetical protein